jgi:hypothetical protein
VEGVTEVLKKAEFVIRMAGLDFECYFLFITMAVSNGFNNSLDVQDGK